MIRIKQHSQAIIFFFIFSLLLFYSHTILADVAPLYIDSSSYVPYAESYTMTTGKKLQIQPHSESIIDTISTALAIKDDRIDLFIFPAYEGLYLIKEKGYYEPLDENTTLRKYHANLYSPIKNALTDNEHLVGWVLNIQPIVQSLGDISLLEANHLAFPETFNELLDVCNVILDNDLLDIHHCLMDIPTYTQQEMLDFYMHRYIMTWQILGNTPDFYHADFLHTVQRIKTELPVQQQLGFAFDEKIPVFEFTMAYQYISTDMMPLPRIFSKHETAIETYATVAVVNPYSKNKEAAIEFLEYCATHADENAYFYDRTMTEPIENPAAMSAYDRLVKELEGYRALETLTQEQQDRVTQLEEVMIPRYEKQRYLVSPEDIAHYACLAQNLYVNEGSPLTYDSVLRQYAGRYLVGGLTLEGFAEACQQHVAKIMQEVR